MQQTPAHQSFALLGLLGTQMPTAADLGCEYARGFAVLEQRPASRGCGRACWIGLRRCRTQSVR